MDGKIWERFCGLALEALSPTRCASCERPGALVCDACQQAIVRIDPVSSCLACGAPFGSLVCTECQPARMDLALQPARAEEARPHRARTAPAVSPALAAPQPAAPAGGTSWPPVTRPVQALDRCLAATVFEGPPARIVRAYKDGGERRLAPYLAQTMAQAACQAEAAAPERYGGLLSAADGIAFVPATAEAYRRRGFDHMELVAGSLAAAAGLPVVDALVKHGQADQRALGRAGRLASSRSAYEAVLDVAGLRLLLIDDVITTGATVNAAAAALKRAGAKQVDVLAFARVW